MKKHLFLFILTLAVLSVSNVWAGEQYIFPVTSASTVSGGTLNKDATTGQWYATLTNADDYVDIPFTWDQSGTECLIKIGYTTAVSGGQVRLWFYRGGSDCGSFGEHGIEIASVITEKDCGAQLTTSKIDGCKPYVLRIKPAASKTMNVYYLKVETNNGATQPTANITSGLDFVATTTTGDQIITNSDFLYSHKKEDRVKTQNKEGNDRTTFTNGYVTAASRKLYTFETGTYKFTLQVFTEESNTYNKPYVFVNNVVAGGGTYNFNKDDASAGGKYRNWEIEIDVTAGTYPIAFYFPSVNEKLFYRLASVEKKATSACPSAYSFHYGTNEQSDWTIACFENGAETDERVIENFTIPTVPDFYVGWQGNPLDNNMTVLHSWNDNVSDLGNGVMNGAMVLLPVKGTSKVGWAQGAVGTLRCWYGSKSKNQYVGFQPNGYAIMYGGNNYAFSETATEHQMETEVVTLPAVSTTYQMGIATADGYTTCAHSNAAEAISNMGVTVKDGGKKKILFNPAIGDGDGYVTDDAKIAVYDVTNSTWDTDFMSDADGDGIYEGHVADDCETIVIARFNKTKTSTGNWDYKYNQTNDYSISGDLQKIYKIDSWCTGDNCKETISSTTTSAHPATGQKGKFRMWANSADQNWYVHFIPYYVLTYNSNGGSGTTAATERNSESSTLTVSVAANGFTAPTGHEFAGWNTVAEGGGVSYAAGASYTLTANGTLYAQWSPLSYTVTLNTNGGTINAGNVTSYTYDVGATLPTDVTKTGYDFGGWYDNSELTGDRVCSIANNVTGNKEYWAKWTAKVYTITNGNPSNGTITVNSTAIEGETVSILATPSSGYAFNEWSIFKTGDASTTIDPTSAAAATSFTMPAYNVTVSATFVETLCTNTYTIDCGSTADYVVPTSGTRVPSSVDNNAGIYNNHYTGYHGDGYYDFKNADRSEIYYAVHLPAARYTFEVWTATNKYNQYLNVYRRTDGGSGDIMYGGYYYSKMIAQTNNYNNNDTFGLGLRLEGQNLLEEDYIIGLYSEGNYAAYDQVVITANSDVFCRASTYDVTITGSPAAGQASATGAGSYEEGETVTINATPKRGFSFNTWSADPSVSFSSAATTASNSFSMPASDVVLTASYNTLTSRTVTVNNDGNGSGSADLNPAYVGETVTLTATPNTGYRFVNWTTSDGVSFASSTSASTTFTMLDKNVTVQANFDKIRIATGDANNIGYVSSEFDGKSSDGSYLSANAVTDPDGQFSHNVLQYSYNMKSTSSYYGIGLPKDAGYTTSVASGATGIGFWYRTEDNADHVLMYPKLWNNSMSKWAEKQLYLPATGGEWKYMYVANDGNFDVQQAGDFGFYLNGEKDEKTSGKLNTDCKFWLSEVEPVAMYSVTVNRNNDSYGTASADKEMYQPGETVTLTATPTNSNYAFLNWTTNDGVTFSNANSASTTFTMPSKNVTVQANFTEIVVNAVPSGYDDCQLLAVHTSGDEYSPTGISNAGWGGTSATFTAFADGSGKKACKINSGSTYYYGINIGNSGAVNHDVSGYTKLHIEFWSAEAQTFNFHVLAHNSDASNQDGSAQSVSTTAGIWVVKDYDLSSVGITGTNLERVYGFKVDYTSGSDKELLIANVYFYKADAPCTVHANRTDLDECRVLSVLGTTTYTPMGISEVRWSPATGAALTIGEKGSNNVWRGTSTADETAFHLATESNIQSYNKIHLEVWTGEAMTFQFGQLCWVDGFNRDAGGANYQKQSITTEAAQWKSLDYTLTDLTTYAYLQKACDLCFYGLNGKNIYITNVYYYNDDATKPVITYATNSGVSGTDLTLTLTATYKEAALKDFRITNTTTSTVYNLTTDGSDQVVIPNIGYCTDYTLNIQAIYNSCILSDVTEMSISSREPAANLDLTRLTGVSATASHYPGGWEPAKAIDGDDNTYWATGGGISYPSNEWLNIDLTRTWKISSVKVGWNNPQAQNLYIEGSNDGTNYYVLKHVQATPSYAMANAAIVYETYSMESHIRVRYVRLRAVGLAAEMAIRDVQIFGACDEDYAYPVMTEARMKDIAVGLSSANVNLYVNAFDENTAPGTIQYKAEFTKGGASDQTGLVATDGVITLTGLTIGTSYTVRIYAYDGTNYSENYKELSFTPNINLYYLTEEVTGPGVAWENVLGNEEKASQRRFSATAHAGIYLFSITARSASVQYRPYCDVEGDITYRNDGDHWSDAGNQVVSGHASETIEVYAKDKDHFVSVFDKVQVYGAAVYAATSGSALTMTYNNNHTFSWQGRVKEGNNAFRIIVDNNNSGTKAETRIMDTNASFNNSSNWKFAKLTFDITTWTYTWEEISSATMCQQSGGEGSGLTLNGATLLGAGESYTQYAYMSNGEWVVEVSFSGGTVASAHVQPFTDATGTGTTETGMTHIGDGIYRASFNASAISSMYKSDGVVRYTIKIVLEGASNVRQTDIHYYDFSGDGACAPEYFDIYHWDDADAADAPADPRTTYAGGTILQPIRYFRHFANEDWNTITLPFEVSKVTVYDNGDKQEYDLYPRFNNGSKDVEGYYWLKTFSDEVSLGGFKSAWQQLTVTTPGASDAERAANVKPEQNTPYVIAFPEYEGYYRTNWVIFHGAAGQTIDADFTGESSITLTDGYDYNQVQLQANNTMHESDPLSNIYMIEEGYNYFTRRESATVPAFEAYVIGTAQVQTRFSILRYTGEEENIPDVMDQPTGIENTPPTTAGYDGEVYTVAGIRVAGFANRDEMETLLNNLGAGVYIVRMGTQINKVVVR